MTPETRAKEYGRVFQLAHRYSVKIRLADVPPSYSTSYGWHECPFVTVRNVGIWWPRRTIYWDPHETQLFPVHLVHEIAHVLVGEPPSDVEDEILSGMLAFEVFTQRRLRLSQWAAQMKSYNIEPSKRWSEASTRARHVRIQESLRVAVRRRWLTSEGQHTR